MLAWITLIFWHSAKPLPPGAHVASQVSRLSEADVEFVFDSPQHPDVLLREAAAIDRADQLLLIDRSPVTRELAQRLLARKHARPNLKVVLVTDPANEIFGGTAAGILASMETAGIIVVRMRLDGLRDSNPLYSGLWRLTFGWWSDSFDEAPDEVTLQAWARSRNFKADQRQLLVADDGSGGWQAILAPAGAAAALLLRGASAQAMVGSELQLAKWSTDDDRLPARPPAPGGGFGSIDARFLTEGAIKAALLEAIAAAGRGDQVSIAVRTFSDRQLVEALLAAVARGVHLRVLLSWNPDPNQAVAGELKRGGGGGIEVRWYRSEAAAPPASLLLVQHHNDLWVNWGSANFTRRNLGDLNLEAGAELHLPLKAQPARAACDYFGRMWSSAVVEPEPANDPVAYWQYRVAEAGGLSSF
jgi:PLD-like domain